MACYIYDPGFFIVSYLSIAATAWRIKKGIINSALEVKNVTRELMLRGWSDKEIALFWGGNLLRVWEQVEKVAEELRAN